MPEQDDNAGDPNEPEVIVGLVHRLVIRAPFPWRRLPAVVARKLKSARIAASLLRNTTLTLERIADRLRMGAVTRVAALLHRLDPKSKNSEKVRSDAAMASSSQCLTKCAKN